MSAQFSPPALGKTNIASWFAIGVKQDINKQGNISSTTHFGFGRISNPDDYSLFKKPSIYVINQEVTHRFKKHWKYSVALSYRWQNKYKAIQPYELDTPKARQEIRVYSRVSYLNSLKKATYSLDYRPEVRFFYNPNFSSAEQQTQFRSRFRGKVSFNLNSSNTHKIIASTELLFSSTLTNSWNNIEYKETRFCLYYSYLLHEQRITFNIGYMNNLLDKSPITDVNYLAFDILVNNPFNNSN